MLEGGRALALAPVGRPQLRLLALAGVAAGGACLLAALTGTLGAMPVLALMLLAVAGCFLLAQPAMATVVTLFLLYVNFPAILTKQHGLPPAVAGAFILVLGFPLLHHVVVRRRPFVLDTTFLLMLAYLAALLLSSLRAVDSGVAVGMVQVYVFEGLVLYWLLVNAIRNLGDLRRAIWAVVAAGSLLGALCLYQSLTGNYDQEFHGLAYRHDARLSGDDVAADPESSGESRAQGPVAQANRFAQIMLVLLPLAVYLLRTAGSRAGRALALAAAGLVLAGIVLSLSRGAFVALAVMALLMVLLGWIRASRLAIACLLLALAVPAVTPSFVDRMRSITDARHVMTGRATDYDEADGAIRGRVTEMLAAFHVFLDYPVLGVGPGQFPPFYSVKYSSTADAKFREIGRPMRAHSLYLELAAELGLVGLVAFLAIVAFLVRGLWRARRELRHGNPEVFHLATAAWLCLVIYLFTGLIEHLAFQRYYWFLIAMASAALHVIHSSSRSPESWPSAARMTPDNQAVPQ